MESKLSDHRQLVEALLRSLSVETAGEVQLIETHISSVILAGDFAYKLKKPLDFGFLDFTSLERRQHFCHEEIRLNGRLAPAIYLNVVPISGTPEAPVLDGDGVPIEFAVRMRRFSQEALMDHLAAAGELPAEVMEGLGRQIAEFHAQAARAPAQGEFSSPEAAFFPVEENFEQLRPLVTEPEAVEQLARLEHWSRQEYARLRDTMADRGASGFVRECHGDMHLGNMAIVDGEIAVFDGIEFNDRLRWTDVYGDVGFLFMDLRDRGLDGYANRFLNA